MKIFYGMGSGLRQNLDFTDLKRMPVVVPSREEQECIVGFFAHSDRLVNRLIRAKRQLIALLNEQKQAIVHRAVTCGLDPNVRLKPSGIDWLGDVPEHWEVLPFTKCVLERADYRGATPEKVDSGVFLVTAKNIRKGWIDYESSKEYVRADQYQKIMRRGLPRKGDVLLTTEAPLGHVALVDREDIALAQRIIRFRLDERRLLPHFALLSMLSVYFQNQLLVRSTGSTAQGIKASKLPQLLILQPPLEEQHELLRVIGSETEDCDRLMDRANREIDLLREYRTRQVADVVTGKLDIRGVELHTLEDIEALEDWDASEDAQADEMDEMEGVDV